MERPKVTWKYLGGQELGLYWFNPWEKREEKIATFWWPCHPVEETATVERWYEEIASLAAQSEKESRDA